MNKNYKFSILDTNNNIEFEEYEQCLYKAFVEKDPDGWIIANYQTIENKKLRAKIPYKDQINFLVKEDSKIIMSLSVNTNINAPLQLEEKGFTINEKKTNWCEGINFFSLIDVSENVFDLIGSFLLWIEDRLEERNIDIVYIVTPRNKKALYSIMGFEKVLSIKFEDEIKILMKGYRSKYNPELNN